MNDFQYGFRESCSTTLAAIELYESVTNALENNREVITISLDLSKAFDSLNHGILLAKLHKYGLRGVSFSWIKSYLTNRYQKVTLDGSCIQSLPAIDTTIKNECIACRMEGSDVTNNLSLSGLAKLQHGVPQGSILGPTLFIIYINDIIHSSNSFQFISYADDTTLLYSYPKKSNPSLHINGELSKVHDWLLCNKLLLNTKKTQAIAFKCTTPLTEIAIKCGTKDIQLVDKINFLGIIFDSKLTFKEHVKHVRKKVSCSLGIINRAKNLLSPDAKKQLYFALVHSHFTYGIELWGGIPKCNLYPLVRLQKRAMRIVANVRYNTETKGLFDKFRTLQIENIFKLQLNKLMFKAFHRKLPPGIQRFYMNNQQQRQTRQSFMNLAVKRRGNKIQNLRPSVSGPFLWNQLKVALRSKNNIAQFCSSLKKEILQEMAAVRVV